jgi:hypothetical protein
MYVRASFSFVGGVTSRSIEVNNERQQHSFRHFGTLQILITFLNVDCIPCDVSGISVAA